MATLNLFLHAPSAGIVSERHFPIDESLERLQGRVEQITGIPPDAQRLSLLSTRDDDPDTRATLITALDGRVENLRQAGVQTAMCIRVDDSRPAALSKQYTDDSQVEKYEMDDETYAKRSDTVLAYKQRAKLGRFDPNSTVAADRSTTATAEQTTLPPDLKPGARCLVSLDGSSSALEGRRGTVRFVGPTEFAASGVWVGVEYDEPVGKNDGSIAGHRYFRCAPLRGGFVRPAKVVVGNYPEESIDSDEEM